ncbi:MAG: metal-dependent hydrolase [Kiritimatiellia bacterium]
MKGISHFAVGTAVASCFPAAVEAAASGNPLYFVLGGVFGLLPDTLDFKFCRFFFRHDIEIAPDPSDPDPRMIARAVVSAAEKAAVTGRPVRIKLDTVRLGADLWLRYELKFNAADRKLAVSIPGPVDTGANPVKNAPSPRRRPVLLDLPVEVSPDYCASTVVDIFDGPVLELAPENPGRITARFLPWHRQWTHGVPACLIASGLAGVLWGPLAAIISACVWGAHIAVDQLGFMGSNLLAPFTRKRVTGMRLLKSGDSRANFAAVWISCLVIFWNLYSNDPPPGHHINFLQVIFFGLALPALLWALARRLIPD